MRKIERLTKFKRDYRRAVKGQHGASLDPMMRAVLAFLTVDEPLPSRYRDHALSGNWAGYRECHIKPDLLLIYKKVDDDLLRLARIASHSTLFK